MGKVITSITMSLDGFVAGPNDGHELPLGEGGERLFEWYYAGDTDVKFPSGMNVPFKVSRESAQVLEEGIKTTGAMVAGRRMFDIANAWGGHPPFIPCFVVTHNPPEEWVKEGSPFVFVTDGVESAIEQAKAAAGDKDVAVATATVNRQALRAGLIDEVAINLVPITLGAGVSLFGDEVVDMERIETIVAPHVTHLRFRVIK